MARLVDPRIPEIGAVSQAERQFIINWIDSEWREAGAPYLSPDFVARQGRHVRIVDIRPAGEIPGALGYVPGADWLPIDEVETWKKELDPRQPVVLISRSGQRAGAAARRLVEAGFPLAAAMQGGMWSWRDLGFDTCYDAVIAERRGRPRRIETSWEVRKARLTLEQAEAHVGDPLSTRWLKLAALLVHGRLSCVDGRDPTGVLGTAGGDAGEFVLALAAVEQVTARPLAPEVIAQLLARRVEVFGRFYVHSDIHASNALIKSMRADPRLDAALKSVYEPLEWRRFFAAPPEEVRPVVLEHSLRPEHQGCGHLRNMAQNPAAYGVRDGLVWDVLRATYTNRWRGTPDVEVHVLPGGHAEGAVLLVVLEEGVTPFSRIPLVSPLAEGTQLFVSHPQVADFLRKQQTQFLALQRDLIDLPYGQAQDVERVMAELGARQTAHTLGVLAKGLPIFEARFNPQRRVRVRELGQVGQIG
jgi:rhodanese-related sulfurtransferase